ncbi:MAG: hypothetical protein ACLSDT_03445 [Blautia sp.]
MVKKIMDLYLLLYCMAGLGVLGVAGMLATNLSYRRIIRKTGRLSNLKEKWLNLWKTRDRLLHRMNRFVWYCSLLSTAVLGLAFYLTTAYDLEKGMPLIYLYIGAAVPVVLMLLRWGLDFSYKESLVMGTLSDYIEQMRTWVEEIPTKEKADPILKEQVVDKITASIRQTAASGSHFSKMLTPEEEEIMREIIREFMD